MDINQFDTLLQKISRGRSQEFTLTYNPHAYQYKHDTLEEWLDYLDNDDEVWFNFIDEKERQQCIEKNTLWIYSGPSKISEYVSIAASELQLIFNFLKKGVNNDS